MNEISVYVHILVMAGLTYLIRMVPLALLRRELRSVFVRSFLYYVPYVTLSVMTFPAVLSATGSTWSALAGFAAALVMAYFRRSLIQVALGAALAVFAAELLLL